MSQRKLTVAFGGLHPAVISSVKQLTWEKFAEWLTAKPIEVVDKAQAGWYCPTEFSPAYRDGDNFIARHAITFDFDHVNTETWDDVKRVWAHLAFAMYTTFSHTVEQPRFRVVIPLSRPAGYDEFQAVARKVATDIGIELIARESFVPAQMMYAPTRKKKGPSRAYLNEGEWLDVDAILDSYEDWTDVSTWPHRAEADGVHAVIGEQTPPDQKPGPIGEFCRAFRVADAIAKFGLPYVPTATEGRWTYTAGSRPEGAIEYDDGLKFHSHHDTDPARGQNNAFDLVRLHKYGSLDDGHTGVSVVDRPSYKAMLEFVRKLPEIREQAEATEFVDLGPLPIEEIIVTASGEEFERFHVHDAEDFTAGDPPEWLIDGILPRAELCVIYGESGSGKSFLSLDMAAAITRGTDWRGMATLPGAVVYVCAEGAGGFKTRLKAYAKAHRVGLGDLPAVVSDAPNMLQATDVAELTQAILKWGRPDVVVIDTLSATTPGGNENSGEDMGRVVGHCKFISKKTGALVCVIHHSGKDASKGARGWSGLRAAADAELEVTRNGDFRALSVTKMKDGEDGMSMGFKLKTVVLGMTPDKRKEETSCVVEHLDVVIPKDVAKRANRPSGKFEPIMMDVLKLMAGAGSVDKDEVRKAASKKFASDRPMRDAARALDGLVGKKLAFVHGDRVSLTPAVETTDDSWMQI